MGSSSSCSAPLDGGRSRVCDGEHGGACWPEPTPRLRAPSSRPAAAAEEPLAQPEAEAEAEVGDEAGEDRALTAEGALTAETALALPGDNPTAAPEGLCASVRRAPANTADRAYNRS
mmetsp:Transcript_53478/g.140345  ORF Transcript_53478/g.140345 Transcript_53478/m.140345 type:complete len:117 (+) Transcript_53478:473-823(+)